MDPVGRPKCLAVRRGHPVRSEPSKRPSRWQLFRTFALLAVLLALGTARIDRVNRLPMMVATVVKLPSHDESFDSVMQRCHRNWQADLFSRPPLTAWPLDLLLIAAIGNCLREVVGWATSPAATDNPPSSFAACAAAACGQSGPARPATARSEVFDGRLGPARARLATFATARRRSTDFGGYARRLWRCTN